MQKRRTKRKNEQKREKRRALAAVRAAIHQSEEAQWTPEAEERELMQNEEERQRVHDTWQRAVERADAAFQRQQRILAERQRLILAIRQANAAVSS